MTPAAFHRRVIPAISPVADRDLNAELKEQFLVDT